MNTLEHCLGRNAALYPDKVALRWSGGCMTYAELWADVQARAARLAAEGLGQGRARLLRATPDAGFIAAYFAVHLAGGAAVPLAADVPDSLSAETDRLVSGADIPPGTADILFTTGTTGRSKGVLLSHTALAANAENLAEAQGFSPALTFVISGPLNHIGSLSKVWPVILTGGTLHLTEGLKEMDVFLSAFSRPAGRYATFLVPAALRMLMALGGDRLSALSGRMAFIETGAAPMAQADMERLCRLFPHSRLFNTYASTETGIVCTHDFNTPGGCVAGCLGRPMKHARVFITPDHTVACQGPMLMSGYVNAPDAATGILRDGTLFTHDLGRLDEAGRLHLSGRTDDVINVGGFKVAPAEVEEAALAQPEVADCVCIGVPHPVMGSQLKLLVVPAEGAVLDKKGLARRLRAVLEAHKVPLQYEAVDSIRRTFNGKIDRKGYKEL